MSNKKRNLLIYGFLVLSVLNVGLWYLVNTPKEKPVTASSDSMSCDVHGFRRSGFKFTKPLLMLDRACDDPYLNPIRDKVLAFLATQKAQGVFESASVYFRMLDNGRSFNTSDENYSPGSMMKIMTLITYLKAAETNPQILNKRMTYAQQFSGMPKQEIAAQHEAIIGKSYSVDQLLSLMIRDSDNNATALLNSQINGDIYTEVLKALNLTIPDPKQTDYPINAENMSRFFRLLYNSTFLSPEMSDKALQLLTESNFQDGLNKYFKGKLTIAHKFGEKNIDGIFQLHEGGIFYTSNMDYLLIVMTKGKNQEQQKNLIADISKLVYTELVANYGISNGRFNVSPSYAAIEVKIPLFGKL